MGGLFTEVHEAQEQLFKDGNMHLWINSATKQVVLKCHPRLPAVTLTQQGPNTWIDCTFNTSEICFTSWGPSHSACIRKFQDGSVVNGYFQLTDDTNVATTTWTSDNGSATFTFRRVNRFPVDIC